RYASPGDQGWVQHLALVRDVADRAQRTVVLVAVKDGSVLGSATIELFDVIGDDDRELPPDTSFLRMVGVDPRAQGRGVGRALVEDVIRRVRAAGKRTLGLRTTPQMEAAHHLYESLGFVRDSSLDLPWKGTTRSWATDSTSSGSAACARPGRSPGPPRPRIRPPASRPGTAAGRGARTARPGRGARRASRVPPRGLGPARRSRLRPGSRTGA